MTEIGSLSKVGMKGLEKSGIGLALKELCEEFCDPFSEDGENVDSFVGGVKAGAGAALKLRSSFRLLISFCICSWKSSCLVAPRCSVWSLNSLTLVEEVDLVGVKGLEKSGTDLALKGGVSKDFWHLGMGESSARWRLGVEVEKLNP